MAGKSKNEKLITFGSKPLIAVDPSLSEFDNHPFFKKKADSAKALLQKVGLPKVLAKKHTT